MNVADGGIVIFGVWIDLFSSNFSLLSLCFVQQSLQGAPRTSNPQLPASQVFGLVSV